MSPDPSATVYYSRRKVAGWILTVAAVLTGAFGAAFYTTGKKQAGEIASFQKQINKLAGEGAKLRASNEKLKTQVARLQRRVRSASGPKTPPPPPAPALAPLVGERTFPPGEAVEVIQGRLFVTVARLDGERARIRIADIREGKTSNRIRALEPGQTWRFQSGGDTFALLFHSLKGYPPSARISIRKISE